MIPVNVKFSQHQKCALIPKAVRGTKRKIGFHTYAFFKRQNGESSDVLCL